MHGRSRAHIMMGLRSASLALLLLLSSCSTSNPAQSGPPATLPAGPPATLPAGSIFYLRGSNELWLANAQGNTQILSDTATYSIKPGATEVAYVANKHRNQLNVVEVASGRQRTVFANPDPNVDLAVYPSWSPSGDQLIVDERKSGEEEGSATIIRADGTPVRPLLPAEPADEQADEQGHGGGGVAEPSWSPDGQRIAFVDLGENRIAILNIGTGAIQTVDLPGASDPQWSPDGTKLVATATNVITSTQTFTTTAREIMQPYNRLVVIDLATSQQTILTNVPNEDHFSARWSPDGKHIAFVGWVFREYIGQIFIIPATGGQARQLTTDKQFANANPEWSPDSSTLIWSRQPPPKLPKRPAPGQDPKTMPTQPPPANPTIWIMRTDGSGATQVIENGNSPRVVK